MKMLYYLFDVVTAHLFLPEEECNIIIIIIISYLQKNNDSAAANPANPANSTAEEGPVVELVSPEKPKTTHKPKRVSAKRSKPSKPSKSKSKPTNKNSSLSVSEPITGEKGGGNKSVWQKQQELMRVLSVPKKNQLSAATEDRFEASHTLGGLYE